MSGLQNQIFRIKPKRYTTELLINVAMNPYVFDTVVRE